MPLYKFEVSNGCTGTVYVEKGKNSLKNASEKFQHINFDPIDTSSDIHSGSTVTVYNKHLKDSHGHMVV